MLLDEESAIQAWKEKVYDKQKEVDPDNEHHWYSLALGFALGLGYEPKQACELANIIDKRMLL